MQRHSGYSFLLPIQNNKPIPAFGYVRLVRVVLPRFDGARQWDVVDGAMIFAEEIGSDIFRAGKISMMLAGACPVTAANSSNLFA